MSLQKNTGAVRRFAWLMKFAAWLHALPHALTPAPFRLMQIGSAFWQSRALYVAAQLDIATQLGDSAQHSSDLAAQLQLDADALGRLLRLLAAIGVFQETKPMVFANNNVSACLRSDHPKSVRAMILLHNADAMSRPWFEHLEHGVRTGQSPFVCGHGETLFSYLDHHPQFDQLFSTAMDCVEALAGDSFATDFDWRQFDRLLDIGGSRGSKAHTILTRHPHLRALVVDRPPVIAEALEYWAAHPDAICARMAFEACDILDTMPLAHNSRDIYFLSAILHGFDDAHCLRILHKLAKACRHSGARVVLLEMVLPEKGADQTQAAFDMQMFMGGSGRERTLTEWQALFAQSGMTLSDDVRLRSFAHMLVLRPTQQ